MYSNQLMHFIITIFFIAIFTDDVVCKRSQHIECKNVTVVEETDPKNRNMIPAFFERGKCKGGKKLPGFQCQAVKTKSIFVTVYNKFEDKIVVLKRQSAEICKEVCVCGSTCSNPQKAICEENYRWDDSECKCIYDCGGKSSPQTHNPESIPRQFFIIGIGALFVFFIIALIPLVFYCKAKIKRKQMKYRYLPKVVWNKAQDERLERYFSAVDGRPGDHRGTSCFSCFNRSGEGDNRGASGGGDEEDAPADLKSMVKDFTANECWEIGHAFFCKNNFREMLKWMEIAEEKYRKNTEKYQESLYTHLAFAYSANEQFDKAEQTLHERRAIAQRGLQNGNATATRSNIAN